MAKKTSVELHRNPLPLAALKMGSNTTKPGWNTVTLGHRIFQMGVSETRAPQKNNMIIDRINHHFNIIFFGNLVNLMKSLWRVTNIDQPSLGPG